MKKKKKEVEPDCVSMMYPTEDVDYLNEQIKKKDDEILRLKGEIYDLMNND